jgi:mycoredoxin
MRYLVAFAVMLLLLPYASPLLLYIEGGLHYEPARQGEVVLLTAPGCGYCVRMRSYLHAGGVPYRELDVERDPEGRRRFEASGAVGVPVLLVGDAVVEGYDPQAIRAAFQRPADGDARAGDGAS